ncbi:UDP-N-acetylglucosamine--N-acetylmuramyl-(pentapeptide) pyrophosphoryl-undecaprenol N-acetylglucosamine transferase [Candidatus Microgenomates bacterium]|nr:UDP-N-acetylglucosamine--N-acetylmuramyl-(pentapeptide) pyrophosphoryl-undecaprenol N-acetylglucosamine transferase [Candidatus Microgenomates bacterium]
MKILITGAHFTPAVALIEELNKRDDVDTLYVGRSTTLEGDPTPSQESKVLPQMGVKFIPIISGRLQRTFTLYTIPSLLKIPIGIIQAIFIILSKKPDLILSFGGYVGLPLVFVGWLFSIPIIVHEQTLVSGLANKISFLFADRIALSFDGFHKLDGKQIVITGNLIRDKVLHPNYSDLGDEYHKLFTIAKKEKLPVVLIMGGNQGSHTINKTVEGCLDKLTKMACVVHITGDNKFKDFERLEELQGHRYLVKKWIGDEYGAVLSRVDFVISRAGINTLTELAYLGKPALVIPIPYLYQDEQNKNAKYFEGLGLTKILPQAKLSKKTLIKNIKLILDQLDRLKEKAKKAKSVVTADAAKRLALEALLLVNR